MPTNEILAELGAWKTRALEAEKGLKMVLIGACAVAVPNEGERAVLQEALDEARKILYKTPPTT